MRQSPTRPVFFVFRTFLGADGQVLSSRVDRGHVEGSGAEARVVSASSAWGDVFGDDVMAAALIDRLVHHCHLVVAIRGNSYRLRQHTELWQALRATQEADAPARRRRATRQEVPTA